MRSLKRDARLRSAAVALLAVMAASLGLSCRSQPPQAYVPGLGEIMTLTQMRHIKLWLAGEARNWPLATYEVDELEEGFADAARFHPTHEGAVRPLTQLIPEFTDPPLRALREAIEERDGPAFAAAYDSLTEACSGCHEAAGVPFNVITRPTANPYSDQVFRPRR